MESQLVDKPKQRLSSRVQSLRNKLHVFLHHLLCSALALIVPRPPRPACSTKRSDKRLAWRPGN